MRKGYARTPSRKVSRLRDESVEQAERRLLDQLDAAFARAAVRAGEWLVCRPGCAECCHGPFPVTRCDVHLLRRGLDELRERDPRRAAAVERRARAAAERLAVEYPGDVRSGRIRQDEAAIEDLRERNATLACPVLDPATQTCDLYRHRPIPCRTFGPPLRFGVEDAPHCRLCFDGAPAEVVEFCRIEPDPEDLENAILHAAGVPGDESWETLIAFALIRD